MGGGIDSDRMSHSETKLRLDSVSTYLKQRFRCCMAKTFHAIPQFVVCAVLIVLKHIQAPGFTPPRPHVPPNPQNDRECDFLFGRDRVLTIGDKHRFTPGPLVIWHAR